MSSLNTQAPSPHEHHAYDDVINNCLDFSSWTSASSRANSQDINMNFLPISGHKRFNSSVSGIFGQLQVHDPPEIRAGSLDLSSTNEKNLLGRRRRRSENHVKRPLNSFMLYRRDHLHKLQGLPSIQVSEIIGQMWRDETIQVKKHYIELATKERKNHAELHPDFTYSSRKTKKAQAGLNQSQSLQNQKQPQIPQVVQQQGQKRNMIILEHKDQMRGLNIFPQFQQPQKSGKATKGAKRAKISHSMSMTNFEDFITQPATSISTESTAVTPLLMDDSWTPSTEYSTVWTPASSNDMSCFNNNLDMQTISASVHNCYWPIADQEPQKTELDESYFSHYLQDTDSLDALGISLDKYTANPVSAVASDLAIGTPMKTQTPLLSNQCTPRSNFVHSPISLCSKFECPLTEF